MNARSRTVVALMVEPNGTSTRVAVITTRGRESCCAPARTGVKSTARTGSMRMDGGVADGRWQMADGRWQMADGRTKFVSGVELFGASTARASERQWRDRA